MGRSTQRTDTFARMDPQVAHKMSRSLEPYHGIVYFLPEATDAYSRLGVTGRDGYFASRSAPLGKVSAGVVIATFFNFNPALIHHAIPSVWDRTTPAAMHDARLEAIDLGLRRLLGDVVDSADVARAAELARVAADACTIPGRPLYAGHATLPWPDEPHLALWHAITLLASTAATATSRVSSPKDSTPSEPSSRTRRQVRCRGSHCSRAAAWSDDE